MAQKNKARGLRITRLINERDYGLHGGTTRLAKQLGVERGTIYRWKDGEDMSLSNLELLAEKLETTPAWIMTGTGPMHPETSAPGGGALPSVARLLPDDRDGDEEPRVRRRAP